jgi:hypothetical protein
MADAEAQLLARYTELQRIYGEDIAQEAMYLTLRQAPDDAPRRLRLLVGILHRAGYHDALISQAHQHTRHRERIRVGSPEVLQALWHQHPYDPARLAEARQALSRLPAWLVEMAANEEAMERQHCTHAPRWWYRYESSHGASIRCKRCTAARTAKRRAQRKRKKQHV